MKLISKSYLLFLIVLFFSISCKNSSETKDQEIVDEEDMIPIYDYDGFEYMLDFNDEKTYVVNFWATWCKPCIKELPYFEELGDKYKDVGVEVILVSLDFPENIESHVLPFIERHNLKSKVVLLDDVDSNRWIPLVSEEWSGAIPATVIYNKNGRKFYERTFTYDELVTELNTLL
ncbi:MAG: redoxin domain-containing protein [Flavobacteriaceae bacterium]|nr:redoxin domain-containing protein [Flavobacteriaceae bacterium]